MVNRRLVYIYIERKEAKGEPKQEKGLHQHDSYLKKIHTACEPHVNYFF